MSQSQSMYKRIIGLSCLMIFCCTSAAWGQTHYSARMYALGGEAVAGIVPDYYTDLMLNPAYAGLAGEFTLNYGQRESPSRTFPYSHFNKQFYITTPTTGAYRTNEFLAYGINLWGWKLALVSEWYIDNSDDMDSRYEQYLYGSDYSTSASTTRRYDKRNYLHAALTCSKLMGGNRILGVRIGASDYYYSNIYQNSSQIERYEVLEGTGETFLVEMAERFAQEEDTRRWVSPYLKIGLLHDGETGNGTEAVVTVSYDPVYIRKEDFSLRIENGYEGTTQTRSDYYYDRDNWIDRRDGDVWSFGLSGRHSFANGLRIFAGGGYSTATYDAGWTHSLRDYRWKVYLTDFNTYQSLSGEADFSKISCFVRGGRTFNLERRLDVTAGFSGRFTRSLNEEELYATLFRKTVSDGGEEKTVVSGPAHFEMERLSARMTLPLAVEFRPVSYFTLFGGLTTHFEWTRDIEEFSALPAFTSTGQIYPPPSQPADTAGRGALRELKEEKTAENSEDTMTSFFSGTFGFSIRYRDHLFFDIYSGSDLTPDYMAYLYLDLRYEF
jgi:hypothetical protein